MLLAQPASMATKKRTAAKRSTRAKRATGASKSATRSKRTSTSRSKLTSATKRGGKTATRSGATRGASKRASSSSNGTALAEYNRKRDFSRTAEPSGRVKKSGRRLQFVVQKHAASHLHYDFRLELGGVMKSWAVPKGPSLDPSVRRLAMEVEDHPIGYNTFEGTIPAGEYGGGTVMLWDRGTYEAEDGGGVESLRRGYEKGDLKFILHGKRLQGAWVLVRMQRPGRPQWLLIKHRDEKADSSRDITAEQTRSVVSRRSMDSIANGKRVWHSNR